MGNCQAAEAATVVIQHPSGRLERVYWSLSASQVMASNPGHYVAAAVILTSTTSSSSSSSSSTSTSTSTSTVKYLKLLRPDDTLHIGRLYRLVGFEAEVLKEFASKKHVKLSRLLVSAKKEEKKKLPNRVGEGEGEGEGEGRAEEAQDQVVENQAAAAAAEADGRRRISGPVPRPHQWRPALQSIAEMGS